MDKRDTSAMNPEIPRLFDYAQHCRNRTRAAASFSEFDFLKTEGALRLADRLELVRRDFPGGFHCVFFHLGFQRCKRMQIL